MERIAARVAEIYEIEMDDIFLKGKQKKRVKARSLFCSWGWVLSREGRNHRARKQLSIN